MANDAISVTVFLALAEKLQQRIRETTTATAADVVNLVRTHLEGQVDPEYLQAMEQKIGEICGATLLAAEQNLQQLKHRIQ